MAEKDYILNNITLSICPICHERIAAKVIIRGRSVFLVKTCREHGSFECMLEEDSAYYLKRHEYDKPGTESMIETETKDCCPFDCGLCPDHEQHTCIGLIEVTSRCDLRCNVCYANSGQGKDLPLKKIASMMDHYQKAEGGKAEILQISGGEPTIHPDILEIIKLAKEKKFRYVMLNTNGKRISYDVEFCKALAGFMPGFEVYLSFDGFSKKAYETLRERDLSTFKQKAVENLVRHRIPITLVVTVDDSNSHELGKIIDFGLKTDCIRGINFQPVAFFGRLDKVEMKKRITLTGVLRRIEEQMSGMIMRSDFVPLPCNPDSTALTFLYRKDGEFIPLTRETDIRKYKGLIDNTFAFYLHDTFPKALKACCSGDSCCSTEFLKGVSKIASPRFLLKSDAEKKEYIDSNTFRISVTSFMDAYNMDLKSLKKECVHILTEDNRRIPFSAYNTIYRKKC